MNADAICDAIKNMINGEVKSTNQAYYGAKFMTRVSTFKWFKVETVSNFHWIKVDTVCTFNLLKVETVSTFNLLKVETVSTFNWLKVETVSTFKHFLFGLR